MNDINHISNRTILRVLALVTVFAASIFLVFQLHRVLVWILVAFFLAVAVNPAVEFFARYMPRRSRGLSAGLVLLMVIAVFTFVLITLVPPQISQTQALIKKLPDITKTLQHSENPLGHFVQRYNLLPIIHANQDKFTGGLGKLSGSAVDLARSTLSSIVATLSILALSFFMIVEGPKWLELIKRLQPKDKLKHREELAIEMYHAVTGWVSGNLLTSLIAAVVIAIMLTILRIPFAIPLGILVGLCDLIPLVGATIGAVVVIFVCLFSSVTAAIVMLIFFIVYQQLENHVMQPYVYSKTVELSPLLVLVAALLGAALAGLVGALLAIPAAACAQILLKDQIKLHNRR